ELGMEIVENRREGVFLDQIEQAFFRFEVIVEAGEGNTAGAGKIAYRGAFISLLAEDLGGMLEDLAQPAIEARPARRHAGAERTPDGTVCGRGGHCSNVRSNYRRL